MAAQQPPQGGKWDAKDHAYEYSTKQPGTHWDAKDHAWEGRRFTGTPPKGSQSTSKGNSKFRKNALKKKAAPPQQPNGSGGNPVPPQFQKK